MRHHSSLLLTCSWFLSVQALEARKSAKLKRVYYDLDDMIKTNKDGQVPYTPVLPLLYGMQASMKLMKDEGFENVIKRHHRYVIVVRTPCQSVAQNARVKCVASSSLHAVCAPMATVDSDSQAQG